MNNRIPVTGMFDRYSTSILWATSMKDRSQNWTLTIHDRVRVHCQHRDIGICSVPLSKTRNCYLKLLSNK